MRRAPWVALHRRYGFDLASSWRRAACEASRIERSAAGRRLAARTQPSMDDESAHTEPVSVHGPSATGKANPPDHVTPGACGLPSASPWPGKGVLRIWAAPWSIRRMSRRVVRPRASVHCRIHRREDIASLPAKHRNRLRDLDTSRPEFSWTLGCPSFIRLHHV